MRTNIVLNDALVEEALTYSNARSKRELVEEALQTFVKVKAAEKRRATYRNRLRAVRERCADFKPRVCAHDIVKRDRQR